MPDNSENNKMEQYNTRQSINILVVEDDPASRAYASIIIQKDLRNMYDVMIFTAQDSKEAYKEIDIRRYDIILMDIGLGSKDSGEDIANYVRNNDQNVNHNSKIISVTAYDDFKHLDRHPAFNRNIQKPYQRQDLTKIITETLKEE